MSHHESSPHHPKNENYQSLISALKLKNSPTTSPATYKNTYTSPQSKGVNRQGTAAATQSAAYSARATKSDYLPSPSITKHGHLPTPTQGRMRQSTTRSPSAAVIAIDNNTTSPTSPLRHTNMAAYCNYEKKYKNEHEQVEKMQVIVDVLNARVQKVVNSKDNKEKEIADLQRRLQEEQVENNALQNENLLLKTVSGQSNVSHSQSNSCNSDSFANGIGGCSSSRLKIDEAMTRLSKIEKKCEDAKERLNTFHSKFSTAVAEQNEKFDKVNNRIANTNNDQSHSNTVNTANTANQVTFLVNHNRELKQSIEALSDIISRKDGQISELKAKVRRKENEVSMLKQNLSDTQNAFDFLKSKYEAKQGQVQSYLHNLQKRYNDLPKGEKIEVKGQNSDIIQILRENDQLTKRVKELSAKNSELVKIIYRLQKGENVSALPAGSRNSSGNTSPGSGSNKGEANNSQSDAASVSFPMSVSYSFANEAQETQSQQKMQQKAQDDPSFSCFVE